MTWYTSWRDLVPFVATFGILSVAKIGILYLTIYTVSCIEEIYKKYVAEARERHPEMFLQSKYTPHTMRHTTATHMLEAGVPLMAIKNFLGHVSVATTERYAELSQTTTDKHIREWNRRWFWDADPADDPKRQTSPTDFLK